jgi:hypothetical protein
MEGAGRKEMVKRLEGWNIGEKQRWKGKVWS